MSSPRNISEMKSILKLRDDGSSNRRRSALMQPSTTRGFAVEINVEDVRLSTVPCSAGRSSPSSCVSPVDVVRDPHVDRLQYVRDHEYKRNVDAADLEHVEEKLDRIERQLDSKLQQYERRLHGNARAVDEPRRRSACRESGPTYVTLADGRRWLSLQLEASGYDPRDVRVLVDRNQLLVDAVHAESHSAPVTSHDVTSGFSSDVTQRRLSRRYLLPGYVLAADLRCCMTSDGTLSIEGEMRGAGDDHVTSTGEKNGGKTLRCTRPKHVKFDLS